MKRNGLLHAITVRKRPGRGYYVIAGAHRLAAARKLKWKTIGCVYLKDCSADAAELVEIDENLIRASLSPAETAMHIDRRKSIYERLHGKAKANSARGANKAMGRGDVNAKLADTFATDTFAKTGQSERKVQREAARAARSCATTSRASPARRSTKAPSWMPSPRCRRNSGRRSSSARLLARRLALFATLSRPAAAS